MLCESGLKHIKQILYNRPVFLLQNRNKWIAKGALKVNSVM